MSDEPRDVPAPRLIETHDGWLASAGRWAVSAPTRDEALARFAASERLRAEISARPDPTPTAAPALPHPNRDG